ncbi:MarR family winged helix-turn-helix transcriptional regulator [Liquorilactobacillus oeni]|uniref:Transcriptional regulator, MarR family n=1 Tax=Liquorilactobacillus oeni DSM 19972 TaxID=1423777 RepID=A0A0R1MLF8_9LACO|nr:MarR family transcriptional regulator [Liquorilactobacillus oeni]KRL05355.1 transcriptional regulator, MarR family [Liquorilactobacillus oeni DSM 19972]
MDNKEIFDELTTLARQPAIWFAARSLYGRHNNQRPDNRRRLLRVLAETDNELTAGAIADILAIRPASVTQIIKKLEAQGYIQRIKDEEDARVVRAKITSKGRKQLESLERKQTDFQTALFDVFDNDEREQFGKSLRKLNKHVTSDEYLAEVRSKMDKHLQFHFDRFIDPARMHKIHENKFWRFQKMQEHKHDFHPNDDERL